ncbi:putative pentatricopeptide repeat-containing protein At3g23330 [Cucurbita pepo subsp. pepo]|uniref:putative pentatricopeptide repeat-containing protein At3g23330 n=1 Tax=Cucurbita pepo subsp. pepo TaxID=3664 RepID=UPI000C9D86B6|nr:putative pentatricopeptide repeat-containing protein At3g23330 [Cucurbita pepo subsp. pepo]
MGLRSNPTGNLSFSPSLILLLLLVSLFASVQVFSAEVEKEELDGPKDLGRRSKISWNNIDTIAARKDVVDSEDLNLDLDSVGLGVFDAFFASLSMIIVSEIGDETFIIAALMAMRHPKSIVLSGALSALIVMTVLSTGLGRIVPNLISRKHTNNAATVLYAFFGLRLLYIAWRSKADSKSSTKKEMEEVEEKLEAGQSKTTFRRFFLRFCTPIFLESFILTFLAEWGDRSQIATIALATHKNALGVAVGAILGHSVCTSMAVIGGSMLASKISQGTVATVGGLLFLGFSLSSYFFPPLFLVALENYHSSNDSLPNTLHAMMVKNGSIFESRKFILSSYVKSEKLNDARKVFDEMPSRDVLTWTVLISGFARVNCSEMALQLFREMLVEGVCPNPFTLSTVLKLCSRVGDVKMGKGIHGWILRSGVNLDVVLENSMLDLYAKFDEFDYVKKLFDSMREKSTATYNILLGVHVRSDVNKSLDLFRNLPCRDTASWNTVICGLMQGGYLNEALELLYEMVENEPEFNKVTSSIALSVVSSLLIFELGRQVHGRIVRCGFHNDGFVKSSLINMYIKCGNLEKASVIYSQMPSGFAKKQDFDIVCSDTMTEIVSRSSMVSGYVRNGKYEDAFKTFVSMVREQVLMDKFTIASVVSACSNAGVFELGRQIHAYIQKTGEQLDAHLTSSLIDMYAKGGSLDCARQIFEQTTYLNVVIWTSMITGCALHGQGKEAIRLFEKMRYEGMIPNEVTFLGVLAACSHAGLLEDGRLYFNMMKDVYAIKPKVEHFTCMVDLYGRAGRLNEVKKFIYENDLSHLNAVWKAFLSSCQLYKDIEMGNWVSERLFRLEPLDEGPYVLLSNMCSSNQKWEEAFRTRRSMQHRGISKTPGQSWIHVKNRVHSFVAGDRSHPQHAQIYEYLDKLIGRLKEIGYLFDVKLVMQDVEEEQGEVLLGWHSEKLAIAYGLISLGSSIPIRIMKNLRICTDCHNFMKLTSQLLCREIIARDIHRFHRFNSGHCSCGDYW